MYTQYHSDAQFVRRPQQRGGLSRDACVRRDRDTRTVFGDYISVHDMLQAKAWTCEFSAVPCGGPAARIGTSWHWSKTSVAGWMPGGALCG